MTWWQVGARRIELTDWLARPATPETLAAKAAEVAAHRSEVLVSMPGVDGLIGAAAAAVGADGDDLEAIALAGIEDVCVLDPASLVFVAGAVCFPNRWRPLGKVGLPVLAVHGPVPRYAVDIGAKVDSLIARLSPDSVVERHNWSVLDDATLYQPLERPPTGEMPRWFRHERQTLRRLEACVLFTIGTTVRPLDALAASERSRLADTIASMPDDVAAYKGLVSWRGPLVDRLRETRPSAG